MKRQNVAVVIAALGACVFPGRALAQASGVIAAGPNPCVIEPGKSDCASYLTWTTQGVARATVYVTAEGKTNIRPREFSASPSCELTRCPAPWIEPDTKYVFTLYDSSADFPGNALSSVTVTASAVTPSGSIAASPNPCVIEPGKADCAS